MLGEADKASFQLDVGRLAVEFGYSIDAAAVNVSGWEKIEEVIKRSNAELLFEKLGAFAFFTIKPPIYNVISFICV